MLLDKATAIERLAVPAGLDVLELFAQLDLACAQRAREQLRVGFQPLSFEICLKLTK